LALAGRRPVAIRFAVGAAALVLAGISGAVAALGDTLYPSGSLSQALGAELSPTSHILVRLRLFHPGIALAVAVLVVLAGVRAGVETTGRTRRLGVALAAAACAQVLAGFLNVLLLAPVWMQLVHLLIADAIWIGYVLLGAFLLAARERWPADGPPALGRVDAIRP